MHLGFARQYLPEPELVTRQVSSEALFAAIPAGHPLAGRAEIEVSDLREAPLVLFPARVRPSFADEVTRLFARSGTPLRVARQAEDVVSTLAYVAAARLCAVVPASATSIGMPGVEYVPMAGTPREPVSCLYRGGDLTPSLQALLDHLAVAGPRIA
jgi:DNA-binding transcriptional LysR family regulator